MALLIRPADGDDLLAVVDVGRRTWPVTYGPIAGEDYVRMGLAKWWTQDATIPAIRAGRVTVAELDGEVVGIAAVGPHERHLVLWKLYVLPEHQGKAIGSALMESVVARAMGQYPQIRLSYLDGNTSAEAFYRSKGFVEISRECGGEGLPENVWMQLVLDRDEQPLPLEKSLNVAGQL
jgi:ribosomal protein S18 acetylase RimI-like enzyme